MKKLLFNIKCDVPNFNGRIYSRAVVEQIVETINTKKIFVREGTSRAVETNLNSLVGICESASITEDGNVSVSFTTLSTTVGKVLDKMISATMSTDCFELTPAGSGILDENIVTEYQLDYIVCIPPQEGDKLS